ncbi:tRNA (adenosine(37)-N6)-dimethylallyltransferase MiaA [Aliarcobacter butzleri]|nr:tRNA (adenosine(37)-N6)-dimethylallyltransferase MiaA [Aliarcobacter butzleri]
MKEIAIIGSTASGKTALSLEIASKTNSIILSLDSLCVYKEIDIVSAKPTLEERGEILHFGIDEVYPNVEFDVVCFMELYKKAKEYALKNDKNLIIVGGTGFYLKALIDGLSLGIETKIKLDISVSEAYDLLYSLDEMYMKKIEKNDKYRVEKAYAIYKQTGLTPTLYFEKNPKIPLTKDLKIFEILWEKEELKKRVASRTNTMIKSGLIDEIIYLERKYTRAPNCMSSIGIVETFEYLDGKLSKEELEEKISQNTMKLAKRQNTFNKGQFLNKTSNIIDNLNSDILKYFSIQSQP